MADAATVHVVVVAAVVDTTRGLLLVRKRDDGVAGCPQGWMRPGESIKETAKRKVSEESGVLCSVEAVLAMRTRLRSDSPPEGDLQILVKCHPLAGAPRPGIFELDAGYVPIAELPELRDDMGEWILRSLDGAGEILE